MIGPINRALFRAGQQTLPMNSKAQTGGLSTLVATLHSRIISLTFVFALAVSSISGPVLYAQAKTKTEDDTVAFFESGAIQELKLVIDGESQQRLRDAPRDYVRCSLIENGDKTYKSIAVKLKGAAGSYRDFDDRPCLTLNIDKYKKEQRFHGMEKFHLNNASQDETFLCEWLGSEFFRKAGVAAPRVGHVRLWINDRDLGLYVLREGFDAPFLKRSLGEKSGNLYDGGFLQDIDSPLELDSGEDPDQRDDLVGLAIACFHPDPKTRKSLIASRLDMRQFMTFMAVERLCGHWDGYTLNMNNYRIYFPKQGKGIFMPHGMDQLFGDPAAGLYDHTPPLIAAAVMRDDEWRSKYSTRLSELQNLFQPIDPWLAAIDEVRDRLQTALVSIDPNLAANHLERVNELKDRMAQRSMMLSELIEQGMQQPLEFKTTEALTLTEWYPSVEAEDAKLEESDKDGIASYLITREAYGDYSSSWRTQVLLPKGVYRLEARVKTEDVVPIPDDQSRGVGIRRVSSGRSNELVGTNDWTLVTYEWQVQEDQRQVELLLELRARHGVVWFDRESLRLRRIEK